MSGDDCIKVIAAIAAAQVGVLAALAKLYTAVTENKRSLEQLHRRVTLKP